MISGGTFILEAHDRTAVPAQGDMSKQPHPGRGGGQGAAGTQHP